VHSIVTTQLPNCLNWTAHTGVKMTVLKHSLFFSEKNITTSFFFTLSKSVHSLFSSNQLLLLLLPFSYKLSSFITHFFLIPFFFYFMLSSLVPTKYQSIWGKWVNFLRKNWVILPTLWVCSWVSMAMSCLFSTIFCFYHWFVALFYNLQIFLGMKVWLVISLSLC